jgi:hypothetical protein
MSKLRSRRFKKLKMEQERDKIYNKLYYEYYVD